MEISKSKNPKFLQWDPKFKKYTGRKIRKSVDYVLKFKLDDFGQRKKIEEQGLYVIQLKD